MPAEAASGAVSIAELAFEPVRFCLDDDVGVLIAPGVAANTLRWDAAAALPLGVVGAVDWMPSAPAPRSDESDAAKVAALLALLPQLPWRRLLAPRAGVL